MLNRREPSTFTLRLFVTFCNQTVLFTCGTLVYEKGLTAINIFGRYFQSSKNVPRDMYNL